MTYNDRSPLENMHCAKLFQILRQPETNVFMALDKAFTTHHACTVLCGSVAASGCITTTLL